MTKPPFDLTTDLGIEYPGIYDRITGTYELKGTDDVRP